MLARTSESETSIASHRLSIDWTQALIAYAQAADFALPGFNQLTEKAITLHFADPDFAVALFVIVSVTRTLAGSYPAQYLSSLRPISVLKGGLEIEYVVKKRDCPG